MTVGELKTYLAAHNIPDYFHIEGNGQGGILTVEGFEWPKPGSKYPGTVHLRMDDAFYEKDDEARKAPNG